MRPAIVALLALAGAASACADAKDTRQLDVVKIGMHGRLTSAGTFIADEAGYFEKEGIRLEFVETPRGTLALPLLERGDLDVLGATTSAAMYAAFDKGAHFRIVADRAHLSPEGCVVDAVVGRKASFSSDSPTAEEVRGKRFSVGLAGTSAYMVDAYLKTIGLTLHDIQVVSLAKELEVQALDAGSIDAVALSEPFLTQATDLGHRILGAGGKVAPGSHMTMFLYGPTMLSRPELAQRFMNAYLRGVRQYREGKTPRNIEMIAKRTGFDPELLRRSCWSKVDADAGIHVEWLLDFQKWAVEKGLLDRVVGGEAGTDLSFVRRASEIVKAEH